SRTNQLGKYLIAFLEPGRYTIKVSKDGYQESETGNFVIPLNKVSVTLPPIELRSNASAPQPQPVNQPAQTPGTKLYQSAPASNKTLINVTDATNRGNYDMNLLTSLPLGGIRSFDQFALLAPGVAPPPATTGASGPGLGPGVGTS